MSAARLSVPTQELAVWNNSDQLYVPPVQNASRRGTHAILISCGRHVCRSGWRRSACFRAIANTGPAFDGGSTDHGMPARPHAPTAPGETNGSANLSDELSRSKGVICPPAGIDPGISAPPVGGGVTPVIPPPGTPGGDPSIIPK
jgi:hypothetical protein